MGEHFNERDDCIRVFSRLTLATTTTRNRKRFDAIIMGNTSMITLREQISLTCFGWKNAGKMQMAIAEKRTFDNPLRI